jgi:Domain of unknown function (DUF4333)
MRVRPPRHPNTPIGVAAAMLAAVCVSACGSSGSSTRSLDSAKVERAIADSILHERGLYTKVACPSKVVQRAGHAFTCTARLDVGSYPVTATEIGDSGQVRFQDTAPLVGLDVADVQRSIQVSVLDQRGEHATVSCPAEVLQRAGLKFTCTAVVEGATRRYPFVVSEVGDAGHVRYVGV